MKKFLRKNANPTLLNLLKIGARIEFPNGVWMKRGGFNYLEFGTNDGFMGAYIFNKNGLESVLTDKDLEDYLNPNKE